MKKLSFTLTCLIGLLLFTSCKKEETIAFTFCPIAEEGYVKDGEEVKVGDPIQFGFDAKGTDLTYFSYKISSEGEPVFEEIELDKPSVFSYTLSNYAPTAPGKLEIIGTIKNAKGETLSAKISLNVIGNPIHSFVGNYIGTVEGSGTIEIMGQSTPVGNVQFNTSLELLAGESDNEVIAYFTIEGATYAIEGTYDDNNFDFDQFSIVYEDDENALTVEIKLDGVLDGDNFHITGTGESEIVVPQFPTPIPCTINIDGILVKQ